jgi:D-arabinonate dehydratase
MEVTDVESFAVSIPLEEPVAFATREVKARDHAIVRLHTDEGAVGVGYTLGYDASGLIAAAVDELLADVVLGEDPHDTARLWREMFDGTVQVGRKGLLLRAISIVDIALWDLKAKDAGQPLYKYLGAARESVPAYASGGYYRENKGLEGLREEMGRYVERGHDTVKLKVGGLPPEEELERVRTVRETIGEDRTLLLDANGAWSDRQAALDACRLYGEYDPYFIEEPVMPDSMELMARVNEGLDYAVAAGELEYTRYGFADLLRTGAVDVVQPDATVVGGVTEWLRVANTAASHDVPVVPHYNWDLHVGLVAAAETGRWVEYFYRDQDVKVFDDVLAYPMVPEEGALTPPDRPGHGVVLDDDRVAEFRVER